MPENETETQALQDFRRALLENEDIATKFRAAFPQAAATLLDEGEMSDADLDTVSGGIAPENPGSRYAFGSLGDLISKPKEGG